MHTTSLSSSLACVCTRKWSDEHVRFALCSLRISLLREICLSLYADAHYVVRTPLIIINFLKISMWEPCQRSNVQFISSCRVEIYINLTRRSVRMRRSRSRLSIVWNSDGKVEMDEIDGCTTPGTYNIPLAVYKDGKWKRYSSMWKVMMVSISYHNNY